MKEVWQLSFWYWVWLYHCWSDIHLSPGHFISSAVKLAYAGRSGCIQDPHSQVNGWENYWHYFWWWWEAYFCLSFLFSASLRMYVKHCLMLSLNKGWYFLINLQLSCSSCILLTLLAFVGNVYVRSFDSAAFSWVITNVKLIYLRGPD